MNKIACLFFFIFSSLHGVTVGNPAEPALIETGLIFEETPYIGIRTSYLSNYIVRAKYKNHSGVELTTSYTNYFGKLIVNILKRADIYAFVGASRGDSVFVNNTQKVDIQQKQMIAGGGGLKLILHQSKDCYFWGFDAKYYRYYPTVDHLIVNGTVVNIEQVQLQTWQVEFSTAFARRYSLFTPYAGVSYLIARQKPRFETQLILSAKQVNPLGLFVGATMTCRDAYSLNVEAKFFNQTEYGVSFDFEF